MDGNHSEIVAGACGLRYRCPHTTTEGKLNKMKHIVIVGGGFAGLGCASKLGSQPDVQVTLIDKNSYHQFQPLLYQVASAQLAPKDVAFMFRSVLKDQTNIDVKMAEVTSVD